MRTGYLSDVLSEADKCLRSWRKLPTCIDWVEEFPKELAGKEAGSLDTVADLMDGIVDLDIGPLYAKIIKADGDGRRCAHGSMEGIGMAANHARCVGVRPPTVAVCM